MGQDPENLANHNQQTNKEKPNSEGLKSYGAFDKEAAEQEIAKAKQEIEKGPQQSETVDMLTYALQSGADPNQIANAIVGDENIDDTTKGNLFGICMQYGAMPTSFGETTPKANHQEEAAQNPEEETLHNLEKTIDEAVADTAGWWDDSLDAKLRQYGIKIDELLQNPEEANILANYIYPKINHREIDNMPTSPAEFDQYYREDKFATTTVEAGRKFIVQYLDRFLDAGADPNQLAQTMAAYREQYFTLEGDHAGENRAVISYGINDVIENADKFIDAGLDPDFLIQQVQQIIKNDRNGIYDKENTEFANQLDYDKGWDKWWAGEVQAANPHQLLSQNYDKLIAAGVPAEILDDFLHNKN